jgi:hypothetical protein
MANGAGNQKGDNDIVIPLSGPPSQAPSVFATGSLFGGLGGWQHVHEHAATGLLLKGNFALDKGKKCVILAHADILAGMNFGAALAHDDVAGVNRFAAELLHAKTATG